MAVVFQLPRQHRTEAVRCRGGAPCASGSSDPGSTDPALAIGQIDRRRNVIFLFTVIMVTTIAFNDYNAPVFEPNQLERTGFWRTIARGMVHAVYWCGGWPVRWCADFDLDLVEREERFRKEVQREQCHAYRCDGADGLDSLDIALALRAYAGDLIHEGGTTALEELLVGDAEVDTSVTDGVTNRLALESGASFMVGDIRVPITSEERLTHPQVGRVVAAECVVRLMEQRVRVIRQREPVGRSQVERDRIEGRAARGIPDSVPQELVKRLKKKVRTVNPAIVAGVKLAVVAKIGHRPESEANRLVVETVARRVMLERRVHPDTQAIYLERIVDAYFTANNYNASAGWYRRKLKGWRAWIAGSYRQDVPGMTV